MKTFFSFVFCFFCLFANANQVSLTKAIVIDAVENQNLMIDIDQVYSSILTQPLGVTRPFSLIDSIATSDLPFFGRSSSPMMARDGGIRFQGPVSNYQVTNRENGYIINFSINSVDGGERYDIHLEIHFDGYVAMDINSSVRSTISFSGIIRGT
jgi:hypothetical protein